MQHLQKTRGGGVIMSNRHPTIVDSRLAGKCVCPESATAEESRDSSHLSTIARTRVRGFSYLYEGTMRSRLIRIALILLLFPPFLAALGGWLAGPDFLHPIR